jgi:hypothetical protein
MAYNVTCSYQHLGSSIQDPPLLPLLLPLPLSSASCFLLRVSCLPPLLTAAFLKNGLSADWPFEGVSRKMFDNKYHRFLMKSSFFWAELAHPG